jgi:hypothetical protein
MKIMSQLLMCRAGPNERAPESVVPASGAAAAMAALRVAAAMLHNLAEGKIQREAAGGLGSPRETSGKGINGIMSPVEYAYTIKSVLSVHVQIVLKFLACLVQKIKLTWNF